MGKGQCQGDGQGEGHGAGFGQRMKDKLGICAAICGTRCINIIVVTIILAVVGLSIAKVVMGAYYINDCRIKKLLPIWLIVSGCAPILLVFLPHAITSKDKSTTKDLTLAGNGALCNGSWLISGTVWINTTYSTIRDGCPPSTSCCNATILDFALAMLIIDWIFTGLVSVVIVALCVAVCYSDGKRLSAIQCSEKCTMVEANNAGVKMEQHKSLLPMSRNTTSMSKSLIISTTPHNDLGLVGAVIVAPPTPCQNTQTR